MLECDVFPDALADENISFFSGERLPTDRPQHGLSRETAISLMTQHLDPDTLIVSTTGKASRELYESSRGAQQRRPQLRRDHPRP